MTAQVLAALAELLKLANSPATQKLVERFLFQGDRYDRLLEEARLSRPQPTEPEPPAAPLDTEPSSLAAITEASAPPAAIADAMTILAAAGYTLTPPTK